MPRLASKRPAAARLVASTRVRKQAIQGLIPIRLLDAYGYMASMAVMPEGHRDHKIDIPNNISQEAKQEASKSCLNCKIRLFRGGCGN